MTAQWWSWMLAGIGITGLWLAGSKKKSGWIIGILVQVLWLTYAMVTSQWGFIASALAYAAVYIRNLVKWVRSSNREKNTAFSESLREENRV